MTHQVWAEVKDHLPQPAATAFLNADHKACILYMFPLYKITLLPQGQTGIHQNSQVLFCKAVFQPEIPPPLLEHGVITSQWQN